MGQGRQGKGGERRRRSGELDFFHAVGNGLIEAEVDEALTWVLEALAIVDVVSTQRGGRRRWHGCVQGAVEVEKRRRHLLGLFVANRWEPDLSKIVGWDGRETLPTASSLPARPFPPLASGTASLQMNSSRQCSGTCTGSCASSEPRAPCDDDVDVF